MAVPEGVLTKRLKAFKAQKNLNLLDNEQFLCPSKHTVVKCNDIRYPWAN